MAFFINFWLFITRTDLSRCVSRRFSRNNHTAAKLVKSKSQILTFSPINFFHFFGLYYSYFYFAICRTPIGVSEKQYYRLRTSLGHVPDALTGRVNGVQETSNSTYVSNFKIAFDLQMLMIMSLQLPEEPPKGMTAGKVRTKTTMSKTHGTKTPMKMIIAKAVRIQWKLCNERKRKSCKIL